MTKKKLQRINIESDNFDFWTKLIGLSILTVFTICFGLNAWAETNHKSLPFDNPSDNPKINSKFGDISTSTWLSI